MSPSFLNRPDGMAVPGMIFAGSVIQRAVHAGCKRSCASRKFGADAFLSCASLPVMWHFRQGAAGLVNKPARHGSLRVAERLHLRRNERLGLRRHRLEE